MIHILSNETINKIAAGEVIENPASAIKELVENSIDAASTSITIEIKGGGFHLIRISDNGCGMSEEDSLLCFERHATSKISTIDDLQLLQWMGFRGEALSSIAAISKITLITTKDQKTGTRLEVEGGRILSQTKTPHSQGTQFEIRSIFYNVPARKKFQKHPAASTTEIHKLILNLALSHPHIGFTLISNEETLLKTPPGCGEEKFQDLLEKKITDLFKNGFLHTKIPINAKEQGYHLKGFLGLPTENRANRTGQYLFVNQRAVISPQISYSIKEGFGQRLNISRYPVFILHLTLPPQLLDVNVHPQKKEVRFAQEPFIFHFVKESVQKAFATITPRTTFSYPKEPFSFEKPPEHLHFKAPHTLPIDQKLLFQEESGDVFSPVAKIQQEHVIALFAHYLLLDGSTVVGFEAGIVIVHLLKIHELLIWENLQEQKMTRYAQGLLIPISITFTPSEVEEIENRQKELKDIGFILHSSGKQTFLVEAIPSFVEESDVLETIRLVIQSQNSFAELSRTITHFALRKKKRFSIQEALSLWETIKEKKTSYGIVCLKTNEIENFFK
jgi:DNA mismatch repair protein MutL